MSGADTHLSSSDLPVVNRAALVLRPTQAYVEWANSCGEGPKLILGEMRDDESTVFLIPEMDFGPAAWLRKHYRILFEEGLYAWCTDEAYWPKDRSYKAFQKLFQVHFHSLVMDVGKEPITSNGD